MQDKKEIKEIIKEQKLDNLQIIEELKLMKNKKRSSATMLRNKIKRGKK